VWCKPHILHDRNAEQRRAGDASKLNRDNVVPTSTAPIRIPDGYKLNRDNVVPASTAPIRIPDGYKLDSSRFDSRPWSLLAHFLLVLILRLPGPIP
jgi:hypothetical protein